jgi:sec-independent protein translocase protein TatA
MFNQIGPLEIGIVLLIVLIIFGPKRLPGLGKQLGTGMREFKDSITGKDVADGGDEDAPTERATLARAEEPSQETRTGTGDTAGAAEPRT